MDFIRRKQFDRRKLEIRQLEKKEEDAVKSFINTSNLDSDLSLIYVYGITHTLTFTYMAILGGMIYEMSGELLLSVIIPPTTCTLVIIIRVKMQTFILKKELAKSGWSELDNLFKHYRSKVKGMWVAHYDDALVATISVDRKGSDTALIKNMCVHSGYYRQGIAQNMLNTAMRFCKDSHYKKITTSTTNVLIHAQGLYKKNGFNKTREEIIMTLLPFVCLMRYHYILTKR